MADWAKIALKSSLIVGIMAAIWVVFTQVPIPVLDYSYITQYAGKALAILIYWIPSFQVVWGITITTLTIFIGLWGLRFALIAIRWLYKVNE